MDEAALESYIVTPPMTDALHRMLASLRDGSKRRAWRITGDYGVGKSTMALVLARLLSDPSGNDAQRLANAIGWKRATAEKKLLPVLVTGSRESIAAAVARGVRESLTQQNVADVVNARLETALQACETTGTLRALEQLITQLVRRAAEHDLGVLLVIDELGKLLEYAAMNPDQEDVFALQRLAEMAARSNNNPLLLVGILHQGFQAYAERLPLALRHEWDKVAGRFEEIVFDQPLVHTAALAAGALGVDRVKLSEAVKAQAEAALEQAARIGWLGGRGFALDPASFYPLHPALLPAMVRFFSQFGQSERSLFGFLLSSEPMGLQAYAASTRLGTGWFDVAQFYDYARSTFGHRLSAANYQNQWLRIVATIDGCVDASSLELKVLKTVGILNLLDADDLMPTSQSVVACLSMFGSDAVEDAIESLNRSGLLFKRGGTGAYRLWPTSSINLQAAVEAAKRAVGTVEAVGPALGNFLGSEMVLARRHYLETGTMRYFELRYAFSDEVAKAAARHTDADGLIILSLADQKERQKSARDAAHTPQIAGDPGVLIGLLPPVWHLASYLRDVMIWQWVESNTPDLANDDFAAAEVQRQIARSRQALRAQFDELTKLDSDTGVKWIYKGEAFDAVGNLAKIVSQLCSDLYPLAPHVTNELVNRNVLSSAAASARMRLIEGLFKAPERALLGIDERKAPPEKSMYLSVLQRGALHVADGDGFMLQIPSASQDRLHLRPSLTEILKLVRDGKGCRIAIADIFTRLSGRPYGVRDGLAPILLAVVIKLHGHELALYENGTFLPKFGAMEFLRLTKAPQAFEIQHCSVEGVRSDVFVRLAKLFATGIEGRQPVLLDVVTQLCQFAAKLPEYTRRGKALSPSTLAVRDALLSAREPATLLFADLPQACGLSIFRVDEADDSSVEEFITRFTDAIQELQNTYGDLIKRIVRRTSEAIGQDPEHFDRVALASRGARVSLAAREPRLRAFALRLRDPALHDEAWAESLASFVVAKPPARWLPGDEVRFTEEIGALAEVFAKVESTIFSSSEDRPDSDAIRLNLTRGDGRDLVRVLHPIALDEGDQELLHALAKRLPQGETQRIQMLANLLWQELEKAKHASSADEMNPDASDVRIQHDH
ncbi:MAG: ATP-binding protein [Mesorhizobium sp.]|uniref:ATP-binding protein n=1 Tax=Mesorhizobium sp. TaxID=1871066 RepID=UPI000FE3F636|nr:ATP-binding protein [Mesorhizobium sp.]RWJ04462.1 MAG: ATP-binding protein [Mesorhizobium sp.]RWJ15225.1 MAG: ATP-binding protein [Mesorhizobium sp.]